jgi:hypothetical protein
VLRRLRPVLVLLAVVALLSGLDVAPAGAAQLQGANRFSNAPLLPAGEGRYTGNNLTATKQVGEPDHAGDDGGASVWYRFRVNQSHTVRITTRGSDFDTLLAVYRGTDVRHLVLVRANDDVATGLTSRVQFLAQAGVTYRIAIDGYHYSGEPRPRRGQIVLNIIRP